MMEIWSGWHLPFGIRDDGRRWKSWKYKWWRHSRQYLGSSVQTSWAVWPTWHLPFGIRDDGRRQKSWKCKWWRCRRREHPSTLTSIANLATTFSNQGRWTEAEKLEVQVMETSKTVLRPEHPSTLTSMWNLSYTLKKLHRHAEALSLLQACGPTIGSQPILILLLLQPIWRHGKSFTQSVRRLKTESRAGRDRIIWLIHASLDEFK